MPVTLEKKLEIYKRLFQVQSTKISRQKQEILLLTKKNKVLKKQVEDLKKEVLHVQKNNPDLFYLDRVSGL